MVSVQEARDENRPEPADQTAARVVTDCPIPGGPWFVCLLGTAAEPVRLGPYRNPGLARADAEKMRQFLTAALCENGCDKDG